jgi:murein DD-endopeptidase MepM/ murein hydrolase activator NlpD
MKDQIKHLFHNIRILNHAKARFKAAYFPGLLFLLAVGVLLNMTGFSGIDSGIYQEYAFEFGIGGSSPVDFTPTFDLQGVDNPDFTKITKTEGKSPPYFIHPDKRPESIRKTKTPFIKLTDGQVTSQFGYRKSPFSEKYEFHRGIDIGAPPGTPVFAVMDGIVISSETEGDFGYVLAVDHGKGMISRYAHIQKALKKTGDHIKSGDLIAVVGNSGKSTGPHLHYEILKDGMPVNPDRFLISHP